MRSLAEMIPLSLLALALIVPPVAADPGPIEGVDFQPEHMSFVTYRERQRCRPERESRWECQTPEVAAALDLMLRTAAAAVARAPEDVPAAERTPGGDAGQRQFVAQFKHCPRTSNDPADWDTCALNLLRPRTEAWDALFRPPPEGFVPPEEPRIVMGDCTGNLREILPGVCADLDIVVRWSGVELQMGMIANSLPETAARLQPVADWAHEAIAECDGIRSCFMAAMGARREFLFSVMIRGGTREEIEAELTDPVEGRDFQRAHYMAAGVYELGYCPERSSDWFCRDPEMVSIVERHARIVSAALARAPAGTTYEDLVPGGSRRAASDFRQSVRSCASRPDPAVRFDCGERQVTARSLIWARMFAESPQPVFRGEPPDPEVAEANRRARMRALADAASAAGMFVHDVPQPASRWLRGDLTVYDREIAIFEAQIAAIDRAEGRIYRGPWFWSHFEDPALMRTIFRGNRPPEIVAPDRYFYRSNLLRHGQPIQWAVVLQWARAYSDMCHDRLGRDAVDWEITDTQQVRQGFMTNYGYIPTADFTTTQTLDRFRVDADLAMGMRRSQSALSEATQAAIAGRIMRNPSEILREAFSGQLTEQVGFDIHMHIRVARDMRMMIALSGCQSVTTQQFHAAITSVAHFIDRRLAMPGAAFASDAVPLPGEVRSTAQACWQDYAMDTAGPCHCQAHFADRDLPDPSLSPIDRYRLWRAGDPARVAEVTRYCSAPSAATAPRDQR